MDDTYEFDAPRFVDFRNEDEGKDLNTDGYFVERTAPAIDSNVVASTTLSQGQTEVEEVQISTPSSAKKGSRRRSTRRTSRMSMLPSEVKVLEESVVQAPAASTINEQEGTGVSDETELNELRQALEHQPMLIASAPVVSSALVEHNVALGAYPQTIVEEGKEATAVSNSMVESETLDVPEEARHSVEPPQDTVVQPSTVLDMEPQPGTLSEPTSMDSLGHNMKISKDEETSDAPQFETIQIVQTELVPALNNIEEVSTIASTVVQEVSSQDSSNGFVEKPISSSPVGVKQSIRMSEAAARSALKLRDTTNIRMLPVRNSLKDGKNEPRISSAAVDPRSRRQSIVPQSMKLDLAGSTARSVQTAPITVMSLAVDSAVQSRAMAEKLNSIVAQTDSALGNSKTQEPSTTPSSVNTVQMEMREKVEAPKFRGTWMPRVADPTPLSYVPSSATKAIHPGRRIIGGGGGAFQTVVPKVVAADSVANTGIAHESQSVDSTLTLQTDSAIVIENKTIESAALDEGDYASSPHRLMDASKELSSEMTSVINEPFLSTAEEFQQPQQQVIPTECASDAPPAQVYSSATSQSIARLEDNLSNTGRRAIPIQSRTMRQEPQRFIAGPSASSRKGTSVATPSTLHHNRTSPSMTGARPSSVITSSRQPRPMTASQPSTVRRPGSATSEIELVEQHHQYRVKTLEEARGRSNVPGYMTPTESSKVKARGKSMTPTRPGSPSTVRAPSPSLPRTPTVTKEFNLLTSSRQRSDSGQLVSSATLELERLRLERLAREEEHRKREEQLQRVMHSTHTVVKQRPQTLPQPFESLDRDTQKRMQQQQQTKEFHSMTEIAQVMFRRDIKPRALSTDIANDSFTSSSAHIPGLSNPKSPHLRVQERAARRKTNFKTTEEMEYERVQQEIEEEKRRKEHQRLFMERALNGSSISTTQHHSMDHNNNTTMNDSMSRKMTEPKPFELESIHRHERAQQELKMQEERRRREEEEKRHFKARPIPVHVVERPHLTPAPRVAEPRQAVAPHCVERAMYAEQLRLNKLEMEIREQDKAREFHARPLPKTTYERGFSPMLGDVPLVEPAPPALRTDERAEKRAYIEQARREEDQRLEAERREQERLSKLREQEELKEYRKQLIHKALPVPNSSRFSSVFETESFNQSLPCSETPMSASKRPSGGVSVLGGGPHRVMSDMSGV